MSDQLDEVHCPVPAVEWYVTLSFSGDYRDRRAAAGAPDAPSEILVKLASDHDRDVRRAAAGNPSLPVDSLVKLTTDSKDPVRLAAMANLERRRCPTKQN